MKKNGLIALLLSGVAAVVYFASMANYAFPGESAHLQALWRGLDFTTAAPYPLMAIYAKLLGAGNVLAPICGTLSVGLLFLLVCFFVRQRIHGEHTARKAEQISLVAATVAAVVFMLTPAVRSAASHLEPRLFDATWALLLFVLAIPFLLVDSGVALVFPALMGALAAGVL